MTLAQDEIKDKIFELEMELKELEMIKTLNYPDGYDVPDILEQDIQERVCWVSYYKDLLKDIEQGE